MIVKSSSNPVTKCGTGAESSFTIKASAQAFKILASNLYSNKIRAVVRELSCNAHDSHVEARNSMPFEVHCPNYLEPWFSVKDFGVGISHEFMMSLTEDKFGYTTVFHSTKNGSNETIGGLGLGRLSAFAYNDSYNVVSIQNGIKRNYVVFLAEDGFPTVTLLCEEPTQEHNGFEVTIPVKQNDFYEFKNEIIRFFNNVSVPYTIKGSDRQPINQKVILEGKGWKKYDSGSGGCKAQMGLIRYDISSSAVPHNMDTFGIVIDFPIGSLEIAPSREALSYSPETKKAIEERYNTIEAEVAALIQAKIDAAETEWEAKLILTDILSGVYGPFASKYKFKYNGAELKSYYEIEGVIEYTGQMRKSRYMLYSNSYSKQVKVSNKCAYVQEDYPLYSKKRLRKLLEENDYDKVYVIPQLFDCSVIDKPSGIPKLSSLPFDIAERRKSFKERSPEAGKRILEYINGRFTIPEDFSLDKFEFYVTVEKKWLDSEAVTVQKRLKDLAYVGFVPRVFWVAPSFIHKATNWTGFYEFTATYLKTKLAEKAAQVKHEDVDRHTADFFEKLKQISQFPLVHDIAKKIEDNSQAEPEYRFRNLCGEYGVIIPKQSEIQSRIDKFYAAKPMMRLCKNNDYKLEEFETEIKQYV